MINEILFLFSFRLTHYTTLMITKQHLQQPYLDIKMVVCYLHFNAVALLDTVPGLVGFLNLGESLLKDKQKKSSSLFQGSSTL